VSLVVIGGGQAGLAVSHELWALGIEHVVLERDRIAETWRRRWDSFRLVTPNWTLDLPGAPYAGDDPDGFVPRDEIVDYLEQYAADLPVRTGVAVEGLEPGPGGGFLLRSSGGQLSGGRLYRRVPAPAPATVRRGIPAGRSRP
jgi:putative flavoprotein involved in K+ transport